jgi:hypothetical protein
VIEGDAERLPPSIGGLVDYAFGVLARRPGLYVLLSAVVFAAETIVEFAVPGFKPETPQGQVKLTILLYTALFVSSYAVAAVAFGVRARLSGDEASSRRIAGAALPRWLPVLLTTVIVQTVIDLTFPLSGLGPLPDPPALAFFTAPLVWIIWGVLSLAPPITALSGERPSFAVVAGLSRAVTLSFRSYNLVRLCLVAFVSIVPNLIHVVALDLMMHQGTISRPFFWSSAPLDGLTVVPLAAIQTVFAIDFARRAAAQRSA